MEPKEKELCIICAWRENCQKRFLLRPGEKCVDFSRDLLLGREDRAESELKDEGK